MKRNRLLAVVVAGMLLFASGGWGASAELGKSVMRTSKEFASAQTTESSGSGSVKGQDSPSAESSGGNPPAAASTPATEFAAECRRQIAAAANLRDQILALQGEHTAGNTLIPFNLLAIQLSNAASKANLYSNVHPDEDLRGAAEACEREVVAFSTDLGLNPALYKVFGSVDVSKLDAEARRVVERQLRDFRRAGVDKDEATRLHLKELARKEVELGQQFDKNIRDDVRSVRLDPAQLEGLPEDYRKSHPAGPDGKVVITTDYPDYIPFRTYSRDAAARMALFREYQSRGYPANDTLLRDLLAVRREKATLLEYQSWADYATETKMIGSAANISEFIERINRLSESRSRKDYDLLLKRKQKEVARADFVDQSESTYYSELVKRENFAFNSQEVRPYFEFRRTRDGLLAVTSRLFGVQYVEATSAERWHPDVDVYDVMQEGRKVGRIYLDLHPREGKYKHAAQFPLVNGVAGQQLPEGALVCNFPDPKKSEGPALMEHDDVVTLFHEFGHLMHHILGGHQRWLEFSGVATEWDFVEAPSQMLEEWAWDVATLQSFAKHHETGEPIPAETVKRMRSANEFGKGMAARHQMFYASMSLQYHQLADPANVDLTRVMIELQNKYSPYRYVDQTHMYASFGHLNGYSAVYYTYMWSLVIAKDLFAPFQKAGLYDPTVTRKYRDRVLARGGSADATVLIKDFLGRPYSFDSFKRWLDRR